MDGGTKADRNLDLVRRFYSLGDVDLVSLLADERGEEAVKAALARFLHPEFEFDYEGGEGALAEFAGSFRGPDALIAGWREWLRAWDSYFIELDELAPLDRDRVLALVTVTARPRAGGEEISFPVGAIWTLEDAKARRISMYQDRTRMYKDAGLER